ncbi:amidohydrolase family protein, partial [Escherichia coli]|nr:amidohydrolase family protein [Escherichia coli]
TGLTAQRFGLAERGQLRPGYFADLVVFDPATVADTATFERPTERAAGIHSVYVNGVPVWREQAFTGE